MNCNRLLLLFLFLALAGASLPTQTSSPKLRRSAARQTTRKTTRQATGQAAPAQLDSQWNMETLHRTDGKRLRGITVSARGQEIEFLEIVRPRGARMFLVVHFLPRRKIARIDRLSEAAQRNLMDRIRPLYELKKRARVEAGQMNNVHLEQRAEKGVSQFVYRGKWFSLTSTADAEATKKCVVRLEQMVTAYRRLLPPRQTAAANERRTDEHGDQRADQLAGKLTPLNIVVYGSMDEYRNHLQRRKFETSNPAYYAIRLNQIVAGGELMRYANRLREVREHNQKVIQHYQGVWEKTPQRLELLRQEMAAAGFSSEEILRETKLQKASWKAEYESATRKIKQAYRRNEGYFDLVSEKMLRRLYHELFHAYWENHLFPEAQFGAPRWLNEGLAQAFEDPQLDAGVMRLDAPGADKLARLQKQLRGLPSGDRSELGSGSVLASLLTAEPRAFWAAHGGNKPQRSYLYSWGLAYYLMFHHGLLSEPALKKYVATGQGRQDPIQRFEALVGMPLSEFEAQWRDAILHLQPARQ